MDRTFDLTRSLLRVTYEGMIKSVDDVDDFNQAYAVIDNAKNLTKEGRDYYIRELQSAHPDIKVQAETAARQAFLSRP